VFDLGSNTSLAQAIAGKLGMPLGQVRCKTFADGEQHVQFLENLRGKNVYLIQSTNPPGDNWLRLFLALDAARGASAHEITAVIPYFGYARQDRKSRPREPISARVFARTLEAQGATRVLAMDVHNDAIAGFFRHTLVDYLYARPVFISYLKEYFKDALAKDDVVVVSPDAGGVVRAQSYARRLMKSADLAIIHKERDIPNQVARMKLIGEVKGKIALIIDDMADTCGTLARAERNTMCEPSGIRVVISPRAFNVRNSANSSPVTISPNSLPAASNLPAANAESPNSRRIFSSSPAMAALTEAPLTVPPSFVRAPCLAHCQSCAREISAVAASSIKL